LRDPDARRRAGALAIAVVMHAAALWALIVLPPAVLPQVERAVSAISVRLYTVAGGADAETDAPLFEPPLAGGQTSADPGAAGAGGAQDGAEDGGAAGRIDASETTPEDETAPPEPEPVVEAEPETAAPAEPAPDPAAEAPSEILTAPGGTAENQTQPAQASPVAPRASAPPPPAASLRDPGAVVATTQPPAEAPPTPARSVGPPSFADILARAESRLDPEDFRMLVNLEGGVQAAVRENFCLSSVDANREAFDCPEGVNPDSARLAQYGLMGLGEEPPEFLEDMDRLAFQLANMGADDSTVRRILLSVQESRREVIEAGPLRRQMGRDSEPENGNDIPGAP
jgi:hypothetical protein